MLDPVPRLSHNYFDFSILEKIILKKDTNITTLELRREDYADEYLSDETKVYIPMSRTPYFDVYFTSKNKLDSCYVYIPKNINEAEIVSHNFNRKIYMNYRWLFKSGLALTASIKRLPIPIDKKYSDEEMFDLFNLKEEEKEYIRNLFDDRKRTYYE